MGNNPYFNITPSRPNEEQDLLEELITESIGLYGPSVWFLPRFSQDVVDPLYGEDPVSYFPQAYLMPMYLENSMGPMGPSEMFGREGMSISDSFSYILSRKTFQSSVPPSVRTRPLDGDLLYVPPFQDLVQIKFVEQEYKFYPLGRRAPFFYYYELKVENFKFSHELFRTGVQEIDRIGTDYNYTIVMTLNTIANVANVDFVVGEPVFQANTGFTADVKAWSSANLSLQVVNPAGVLSNSAIIHGNTSNALYTIGAFNYRDMNAVRDNVSDNLKIETDTALFLDTGQQNAFGVP